MVALPFHHKHPTFEIITPFELSGQIDSFSVSQRKSRPRWNAVCYSADQTTLVNSSFESHFTGLLTELKSESSSSLRPGLLSQKVRIVPKTLDNPFAPSRDRKAVTCDHPVLTAPLASQTPRKDWRSFSTFPFSHFIELISHRAPLPLPLQPPEQNSAHSQLQLSGGPLPSVQSYSWLCGPLSEKLMQRRSVTCHLHQLCRCWSWWAWVLRRGRPVRVHRTQNHQLVPYRFLPSYFL